MGNVYTEPGSDSVHITDINNTHADLVSNLDKCQIGIETDTLLLGYKDQYGDYHNAGGTIPESNTNLPAVSGHPIIWFNPITGWLMFRKRSEDGDANVYEINLSDPIPDEDNPPPEVEDEDIIIEG